MPTSNKQSKAQKLLLDYRPTAWRKSALEAVRGMSDGVLQACTEQMHFTQALVEALRNSSPVGEKLYWVIYVTYMTDRQPGDVHEILDEIANSHEAISRRTYFRLKGLAIRMLDDHLREMASPFVI